MKTQAATRRIHEHGREWIFCNGVRFNDGRPDARLVVEDPHALRAQRLKSGSYALLLLRRMTEGR